MKSWAEIGFEIETTGDGSPSLRLLQSVDPTKYRGESMHHSGGACAETLLIYGQPAAQVFKTQNRPCFLVVGLGMGYIELTIAQEALLAKKEIGHIISFESVPELRQNFWNWLHENKNELHQEVWQAYDWMASSVVKGSGLAVSDLKEKLRPIFKEESDIHHELNSNFHIPHRAHGIMYDAFSSKTTPHLWEEEFLVRFLNSSSAEFSLFSTYASRVGLKNALKRSGFEVIVREGFMGKRNSTLGIKGE